MHGVLSYDDLKYAPSAVLSSQLPDELKPSVTFALTLREVVKYKVGNQRGSLAMQDLGIDKAN